MEWTETFWTWSRANNVSHIISTVKWVLTIWQFLRMIALDLPDLHELTFFITNFVGRLQWIHRSCRPKVVLGNIIIIKGVKFCARSYVWSPCLCSLNIAYWEDISCLIVLLNTWLGTLYIFVVDLVTDEFGRCYFPILHLGKLVFGIQRIWGLACCEKALTLRLWLFNIWVRQIILRLIELWYGVIIKIKAYWNAKHGNWHRWYPSFILRIQGGWHSLWSFS